MILVKLLDKYFPFLTPIFLILGLLLGANVGRHVGVVPWLFAWATFIGSLKIDFNSFVETVKHPKGILVVMLILRVLMPVIALGFGLIFFSTDIYTRTGLLLFGLLPVAINSVLWTVITKGNVSLTLSVVLLDTVIAPLALPFSILLLTGARIDLDTMGMMRSLLLMVVLPSLAGMSLNQLTKGAFGKTWSVKLAPLAKVSLLAVILINGGNIRRYFPPINLHLLAIMLSITTLAVCGYILSWKLAKWLKLPEEDVKAVVFSGGMRNMSTGVVIAVAYFPPAAAIPIVTGIFFQQLVCATIANLIENYYKKSTVTSVSSETT